MIVHKFYMQVQCTSIPVTLHSLLDFKFPPMPLIIQGTEQLKVNGPVSTIMEHRTSSPRQNLWRDLVKKQNDLWMKRNVYQIQNHSSNNPLKSSLFWVFILWCSVSSFGMQNRKSKWHAYLQLLECKSWRSDFLQHVGSELSSLACIIIKRHS